MRRGYGGFGPLPGKPRRRRVGSARSPAAEGYPSGSYWIKMVTLTRAWATGVRPRTPAPAGRRERLTGLNLGGTRMKRIISAALAAGTVLAIASVASSSPSSLPSQDEAALAPTRE